MGCLRPAVVFMMSALLSATYVPSQTSPRIRQPIDSRNVTTLRGVPRLARPEFDQGALNPSQTIHRVLLGFTRSAAQQQTLDQLLIEQQDPSSPNYHKWLTPEEFGARFGMDQADLSKIEDWLLSQGFAIDAVARGRSFIAFTGTAGQINSAFRTELHQYVINGEVHFANATPPSVPTAMAAAISGIRSLNDFKPKPRSTLRRVKPSFTSGISGNHYLAPDDFATIYNINALYAAGIDGLGEKLAVVGQTDLVLSDIATFRSVSNLPVNPPQVILVSTVDPGIKSGDIAEASLDVEWAGAVARRATIIYVNSNNGVFDSLFYAIDNDTAPVISISYGACEPDEISGGYITTDENMLQQAAAQGQTVVGPSGDSGAADCDSTYPVTDGLAVDFPASSLYVTGVGGTTPNEGTGTYWSTLDNINQGSALFYIPEVVWNDSASGTLSATGGGASQYFAKPSWQTASGVPNDGHRDVPDVAFPASPNHDGFIICVQGDCKVCFPGDSSLGQAADANCTGPDQPGYRSDSTNWLLDIIGGTSAGAPNFAGLVALLNQKMGSPQGLLNPRLYQLAGSAPFVFHDVTSGNNLVPCTSGPDCPVGGGSIGFSAGPGYDQVTGLGSVDGYSLLANWESATTADFGISFFNPSIVVTRGTSANATVILRKQNGFSGMVNLSCSSNLPGVTCTVTPSVVTPDASATVTITASQTAALRMPISGMPFARWWTLGFAVMAMFGSGEIKKRSALQIATVLFLVALATALLSCGGAVTRPQSSTAANHVSATAALQQQTTPLTAAVNPTRPGRAIRPPDATVTVQATSGNLSHSANILITVN